MRAAWQVSIRRACAALQAERSSYHYKGKRPDQAALKARIKEIAETRVRYGYRRITVLLKREGWPVNGKRIYRLYKELGLQLRNKTPKRKVEAKLRDDRRPAARPNDIWAMDFLHDELFDGRKIRILAVVDTFSRFSPALDPRFAYKAADVVETLERIGKQVGIPEPFVSTMGRSSSPRTSIFGPFNETSPWTSAGAASPPDNAFAESFNGKVRAECLNTAWFMSLDDARSKCETWRRDYNEERPHSSIGDKCPIELMNGVGPYGPPDA